MPPRRERSDDFQLTEEPSRQIEEMHALIQEVTTAGQFSVAAPLLFVADAPSVAVNSADEEERAQMAAGAELMGLSQCGMESQREADFKDAAGRASRRRDFRRFCAISPHWLLAQNVFARSQGCGCYRREELVACADSDDIHPGVGHCVLPAGSVSLS